MSSCLLEQVERVLGGQLAECNDEQKDGLELESVLQYVYGWKFVQLNLANFDTVIMVRIQKLSCRF